MYFYDISMSPILHGPIFNEYFRQSPEVVVLAPVQDSVAQVVLDVGCGTGILSMFAAKVTF